MLAVDYLQKLIKENALLNIKKHEQIRIVPHPRTLRKAREQVKCMVNDGLSFRRIKTYLHRFVLWWANTTDIWSYEELVRWHIDSCWDNYLADAARLLSTTKSHTVGIARVYSRTSYYGASLNDARHDSLAAA